MTKRNKTQDVAKQDQPSGPRITFAEYASGLSPVAAAGVQSWLLVHPGPRKRTAEEWAREVAAFRQAPA